MSNYPPPPPPGQNFPPPGGQQPFPQQPYGQPGPGYQMPGAMQTRKTSGAAITSLVCGLLFCIPGLTGIIAVITGLIGMSSTSKPNVGGRGMAITGLILGLLSIGGWSFAGYKLYGVAQEGMAIADDGKAFANDVIAGNYTSARQYTTSTITDERLKELQTQLSAWGTLSNVQVTSANQSTTPGGNSFVVNGTATFTQGGNKNFNITVIKQAGKWKIDDLKFQ